MIFRIFNRIGYPDTNLLKPHLFVLIVALYAKCQKLVAIEGRGWGWGGQLGNKRLFWSSEPANGRHFSDTDAPHSVTWFAFCISLLCLCSICFFGFYCICFLWLWRASSCVALFAFCLNGILRCPHLPQSRPPMSVRPNTSVIRWIISNMLRHFIKKFYS